MRRVLLSAKWISLHLALLASLTAFALLGRWQWDVSRSATGSLQNTIYAFQWWSFGLLFVYAWWRMVREELRGGAPPPRRRRAAVEFADQGWAAATIRRHDLLTPPDDATDAELAEFRRHLADLHASDQARQRPTAPAG